MTLFSQTFHTLNSTTLGNANGCPKDKSRLLLFKSLLLKGHITSLMCLLVSNCISNEFCPNTTLEYKGHMVSFPTSVKDAMYSYDLNFKRGALLADTAIAESRNIVAYYRWGYDDNRYTVNDKGKDELLNKGIYGISFLDWKTNDTKSIAEQLKSLYNKPIELKKTRFQKITYYKIGINSCLSVIVFGFQPINVSFCYRLADEETDRFVESNGSIILD
ncbi:hypothetical protein [Runella salmonicolor]|uniref:Lipoprotein n=1 Tax=Runella salmonicolor TaxID=2950278 RepID=A0ABT1FTD8_9BACT|nr:hypothetical protein [Runella salmonicolor]MCP1384986.1 hypothetical protein [Runella salmonicolor]